MNKVTLFQARRIVTMDAFQPHATHVAVQNGKIVAVGDAQCADRWGQDVVRDDRLRDAVLMPGFVEGHAHLMAGGIWRYTYVGYHDRIDPDSRAWPGLTSALEVTDRLRAQHSLLPAEQPLVAWGFDPVFLKGERLNRHHLDQVSPDRPIAVLFSNLHLMCVNSAALALVGYGIETLVEGVVKDADDFPTGELQEMAAMFPLMRRLGVDFRNLAQTEDSLHAFGRLAVQAGVTTMTDLFSTLTDDDLTLMQDVTSAQDYPLRIVPVLGATGGLPEEIAARVKTLAEHNSDKLRFGAVKLLTDGSIQGWTARVRAPGYVGGQPNGLWNIPPAQIHDLCDVMQREGIQMHLHANGDEASEVCIDAIEAALRKHPAPVDHRHVIQHGQMMDEAQFRRCAELGMVVNLFANHLWYFGDQHVALTIGDERANRMDACRSALDSGLVLAIHSDAPVTPLGPLFTAWCAVNRQTMTGRVLGQEQRLTVAEALYALTLGAAKTLKMEHEVGSITVGKIADFAVLGKDPEQVAPEALCDIPVLGTVASGKVFLT
ncbi:amidohydrolase [Phaeobacter sp. 11ANDIMAR09]|uniref:amidohydrolase n=1 Tax=Phaeobacter sp. 11ANDIMAR09 TaxID=1225647 RepID=UPI0006C8959A|nr:amidohydrolase [Phaeobacter sp. 11ANDIMAR09]KPD10334.1 amidohydrolase [Phaeobacter sp. 11ANDIMAR09]